MQYFCFVILPFSPSRANRIRVRMMNAMAQEESRWRRGGGGRGGGGEMEEERW